MVWAQKRWELSVYFKWWWTSSKNCSRNPVKGKPSWGVFKKCSPAPGYRCAWVASSFVDAKQSIKSVSKEAAAEDPCCGGVTNKSILDWLALHISPLTPPTSSVIRCQNNSCFQLKPPKKRERTITGAHKALSGEIRVFIATLEFRDALNSARRKLRRIS